MCTTLINSREKGNKSNDINIDNNYDFLDEVNKKRMEVIQLKNQHLKTFPCGEKAHKEDECHNNCFISIAEKKNINSKEKLEFSQIMQFYFDKVNFVLIISCLGFLNSILAI